ncbi:MAG TPA: TatD family hydrolase [Verrucomicrobiota bacterium]|nr:TatD family hydrolase [Verrucomicrobiota bacterium]
MPARGARRPRPRFGRVGSSAEQEEVFAAQFRLAAARGLPASLHCLQIWSRLHDLLRGLPRPAQGFLLHSYGGPAEMVASLTKLGAYFGFSGHFLHPRKARQRESFKLVPVDRLLVETDAPDQLLPDELNHHPLRDAAGRPVNHPANLAAVYEGLAALRGMPPAELSGQVEENFRRLFGA